MLRDNAVCQLTVVADVKLTVETIKIEAPLFLSLLLLLLLLLLQFGHIRIHASGIDRNLDKPNSSNTPTMPSPPSSVRRPASPPPPITRSASSTPTKLSPSNIPSQSASTTTCSTIILTEADTDIAKLSCPHCSRTFTSSLGSFGH
nr:unnamed protein product [Spirometra erinaceieuropaei]